MTFHQYTSAQVVDQHMSSAIDWSGMMYYPDHPKNRPIASVCCELPSSIHSRGQAGGVHNIQKHGIAHSKGLREGALDPTEVSHNPADDTPGVSLFYDMDEVLAPMEREPATYPMEIILDSGASDHVAAREGIPGYAVEESPGSRAGRHYTGASGHRIANEGQASVLMALPAGEGRANDVKSTIQVANVTRPLMSVSKICANGMSVLCKKDCALILDKHDKVVGKFEQRNGLYTATVQVRNPKAQGFPRPDR